MRPLLSSMMPRYFPDTSRCTNVLLTHDEEQPKYSRKPSTSSGPPASSYISKPSHSKVGTNRSSSKYQSELKDMTSSRHASSNYSASVRSVETRSNGPLRPFAVSPNRLSPLRMSPWSPPGPPGSRPITPRLPRLPENLAGIGPRGESSLRNSLGLRSPQTPRRTPRAPVFQKPLPITPFPVNTDIG